jgi:hypothetical protein
MLGDSPVFCACILMASCIDMRSACVSASGRAARAAFRVITPHAHARQIPTKIEIAPSIYSNRPPEGGMINRTTLFVIQLGSASGNDIWLETYS